MILLKFEVKSIKNMSVTISKLSQVTTLNIRVIMINYGGKSPVSCIPYKRQNYATATI